MPAPQRKTCRFCGQLFQPRDYRQVVCWEKACRLALRAERNRQNYQARKKRDT